jgi:tetratricopeptide (TPR) repeat protein
VGLGEQITSNVEFFVPSDVGGLPGLAQRAGLGIYRAVRDRVREGKLLADCDMLGELIDAEADYETLSFLPYLLAWDLERLPRRRGRRPTVCVFVDTFEALADDGWLVRATQQLVEAGQWTNFAGWLPTDEPTSPQVQAVNAAIRGVLLRRSGDPGQAVAVLEQADSAVEADSEIGHLVRLHLAHALRNTGDYMKAAEIYRALLGGPFTDTARYWLCDHDYLNGRFTQALAELRSWQGRTPADEGERLRLVGHISRVNALFDHAAETYSAAIELASTHGLAAAEAKALTKIAQTACWSGDVEAVTKSAVRARDLLDLVPNPVELVKLHSAEAIATAIDGHGDASAQAIDETRQLADNIGYRGGHTLADVSSIVLDVRAGDLDRARHTLHELAERTKTSGGNTYWIPIAASWIDDIEPDEVDWPEITWLDGPDTTLRRWARVVR